ncbi:MAG: hypothetical protein R3C99_01030 [Pirellulaceae bacterium]
MKTIAAIISLAAAWIAGWKVAVDLMLVEYSKLPTTDPNCYVSRRGSRMGIGGWSAPDPLTNLRPDRSW